MNEAQNPKDRLRLANILPTLTTNLRIRTHLSNGSYSSVSLLIPFGRLLFYILVIIQKNKKLYQPEIKRT